MKEEIKNGLQTIGAPLLALVLVFSLVAMPVSAATVSVNPIDDNSVTIEAGDELGFDVPTPQQGTAYSTDYDGDGTVDYTDRSIAPHTYTDEGTYTLTVTLIDGLDGSTIDEYSMSVIVESPNTAPVIDSGLDPDTNVSATVNESVSFNASNSSDADSDDLTYSWDFNEDGTEDSANATASYTYDSVGEYNATLTVSDGTDSVSETYTVVVSESTDDSGTDDGAVGGGAGDTGVDRDTVIYAGAIVTLVMGFVAVATLVARRA